MVDRGQLRGQLWSETQPEPDPPQHDASTRDSLVGRVGLLRDAGVGAVWDLGFYRPSDREGTYGANPFGMAEAVDIHIALRSYTAWGARQMFLENKIGSLEVGKRADIAIWDRDLYSVATDHIKDMKCLMTLLDGEVVYSAAGSPLRVSRQ